jgi:hypothetical protein
MRTIEWPSLARALALITAIAFVASTILLLLLNFNVFGAPPFGGVDFLDEVLADFEYQQTQWPFDFAASALLAVGFLALGALGPVLARLADETDARRGLVAAAFLGAGGLGAASQLVYLGAKPIATNPQYCECGFLAEEIMSRVMILNVVTGIQNWLIIGSLVAAAVGLVIAGTLGREAGMPSQWLWLGLIGAALAVVLAVVSAVLPPFVAYPWDVILIVLVAGITVPIWVAWLAARARQIWPVDEGVAVDEEPAPST